MILVEANNWRVVSLIFALCGVSAIVSLACDDNQEDVVWKDAISHSLASDSFHFRIGMSDAGLGYVSRIASENAFSPGTKRKFVIVAGAFQQPDRVRWRLPDIDGGETRQIAAEGFVFTKMDDREFWRAERGRDSLEYDPRILLERALDSVYVTEIQEREEARRFSGIGLDSRGSEEYLIEIWVDDRTNLLSRIAVEPISREDDSAAGVSQPVIELDLWGYGEDAKIETPSKFLGDGVRIDGSLYLWNRTRGLDGLPISGGWGFCAEVRNVGFRASPPLTVELTSDSSNMDLSERAWYRARSRKPASIPAGDSKAYDGTVGVGGRYSTSEERAAVEDLRASLDEAINHAIIKVAWTDSHGKSNYTLLLSKEFLDTRAYVSPDQRRCQPEEVSIFTSIPWPIPPRYVVGANLYLAYFSVTWLVAGIAWAPFAGIISVVVARRKKLELIRHWVLGTLYSALLILPWIYLLAKMSGKSIPSNIGRATYFLLYGVVWLFGLIPWILILMHSYRIYTYDRFQLLLWMVGLSALLAVNALTWGFSLWRLLRRHRDSSPMGSPPDRVYITPFALAVLWTAIPLVLTFLPYQWWL